MPPAVRGALWMLLAALAFSGMGACIRTLATTDLHPLVTSFFRSAIGLVLMLPFFMRSGWSTLKTRRHGLLVLRGGVSAVAQAFYFISVALLPLAEAVSLTFTAPLFGAVLAVVVLGEAFNARRIAVTAIGFVGVVIILRPGFQALDATAGLPLMAAISMSIVWILVKKLSATESTEAIVFYMIVYTVPIGLAMALFVWQNPRLDHVPWLVLTAVCANVGQIAMTNAYRAAEASAVFPFDFARLPFTAVLAYFMFSQSPDLWTWIGAMVIFAASAHQMRSQARTGHARTG
jgi:drug/metabolite transporter (DMT)-like permease